MVMDNDRNVTESYNKCTLNVMYDGCIVYVVCVLCLRRLYLTKVYTKCRNVLNIPY